VDRNTVRKYVAPAVAAGIVPGGAPISPERWQELVRGWFPQLVTTELRHPRFGEIAPFHELIREQLATNTVATIWQRLRDEHGLQASIASFRRYVWATMPDRNAVRGHVTVRKPDPPPGEEAQDQATGCRSRRLQRGEQPQTLRRQPDTRVLLVAAGTMLGGSADAQRRPGSADRDLGC
jgi:hypothetical protein